MIITEASRLLKMYKRIQILQEIEEVLAIGNHTARSTDSETGIAAHTDMVPRARNRGQSLREFQDKVQQCLQSDVLHPQSAKFLLQKATAIASIGGDSNEGDSAQAGQMWNALYSKLREFLQARQNQAPQEY